MKTSLSPARPRDSPGVVGTDELGKEAQPSFLPPHPEVGQVRVSFIISDSRFLKLVVVRLSVSEEKKKSSSLTLNILRQTLKILH